jgi:16S rRNA (uracil1498-N3)-methyltransferase
MSERFFALQPLDSSRPMLGDDEVRHLVSVMRAKAGDEIILFDGSGDEWRARIEAIKKQTVELVLVERRQVDRELPFSLTLAVALPKGDRQKWLVEKATELGVTHFVPLITERGVAQPVAAALVRLRRSVIEASKQCGRNRLMEIAEPVEAAVYWSAAAHDPDEWRAGGVSLPVPLPHKSALKLLADPTGTSLASIERPPGQPLIAAVGPEGGFTSGEVAAATAAGWQTVSLGPRILRVETAAIALAAWGAAHS